MVDGGGKLDKMTPASKFKDVRILLVGEDGVGKTSLILTLISEEFPDLVPAKAAEITIPGDVTPEKVPTHIVDFSMKEQSEDELHEELRKANAICVVYSSSQPDSIEKITSYWMPTIQTVLGPDHGKPVILVGNKSDQSEDSTADILPIMSQYNEIETCVECSAKDMKNISELFYYAQKAVLHPTGPLYVPEDKELTQSCKKALVRIFKICDRDNDGLLNDEELNEFQVRCFNVPLTTEALQDIKSVVKRSVGDGILDNALTLKGFLYLHTLFIQRGRHETTWTVLRRFGYDNSLQLSPEYLLPTVKIPNGCTTELSFDGYQFLTGLFEKYDEDKDNCLSPTELQNLFSVCPVQPWGPEVMNSVTTNSCSWVDFNGYLSYWHLTTLLDLPRTLEYLAYLGYVTNHRDQTSAITITREKKIDWQKKSCLRNVLQCHVIGPKNAGKTAFLQAFIGRTLKQQSTLNKKLLSHYAINSVEVSGQQRFLLLHEIDVLTPEDALTPFEMSCDCVCLVYDASDHRSFEYCARMYKKFFHRSHLPVVVVATKSDRREVLQDSELQPLQFCRKYRLPPPLPFTAADVVNAKLIYTQLAAAAMNPGRKHDYLLHDSGVWVKVGIGVTAALVLGFVISKNVSTTT